MEIIPKIIKNNIKVLSIFGLSKNCGKTTTLIKLIKESHKFNLKIFITSIGLDGEKFDSLYYFEKPLIKGYKENFIVTSKKSLENSNVKFEIIEKLNIFTPLGELYLIKLKEEGYIEVSGPIILSDLKKILNIAKNYEIDLILIDGAVDRKIGTYYSDGVILQTGLNIGESVEEILEETLYYKDIFTIKTLKDDLKNKILHNYPSKKYLLIRNNNLSESDDISNEYFNYIFIKGAFTYEIYEILKDKKNLKIVVEHPTKIFLDIISYKKMREMRVKIFTLKEVKLIGISFSTFNQESFFNPEDSELVYKKLKETLKTVPIFNVIKERDSL